MSINSTLSKDQNLECGVPQGSVLGAMMYIMYVYDLSKSTCQHNVKYQSYADDTQKYVHCDRDDLSIKAAIHKSQECIADVCVWMDSSALRLKEAKTEFIIFKPIITDVSNFKLKVGTSLVHSSNQVKILGVTLDSR